MYTRRVANRYAKAYSEDPEDLYQEGMLAALETQKILDDTKSRQQVDSFIKQNIKWAMLSYVAKNYCDVKVNKTKFFEGHVMTNVEMDDDTEVILSGMNPEDLYILFEDKSILTTLINQFEQTLDDDNERFVWYHVIKTDDPMTTREAAKAIGVASNKTVANIRHKLEQRFHDLYTGGV